MQVKMLINYVSFVLSYLLFYNFLKLKLLLFVLRWYAEYVLRKRIDKYIEFMKCSLLVVMDYTVS